MDKKREPKHRPDDDAPKKRRPYVRPELVFLGSVTELTRGGGGSAPDGLKGGALGSTIRVKKDVVYLDEGARAAVARDALSLRLATWEYRTAPEGGHRHLGIIIEDNPTVAAVTPSKETVDLYSYASMAIAAAQVQAAQIEELRAEVAKLHLELADLKKA